MDHDEPSGRGPLPIDALAREDLAPLSHAELEARVARLEAEIARVRRAIEHAVNHRATAEAIFKS